MGFRSQDAWRKHPVVSGNYKGLKPFPGLVLSIGIFSVYVAVESLFKWMTYSPKTGRHFKYTKEDVGELPELEGKPVQ